MHNITVKQTDNFKTRKRFELKMQNEEGEILTSAVCGIFTISFGAGFIDALSFSAVETPMQHRRKGYVRELFDFALNFGIEQGCVISILHPFSFSYYEKFGYGKVADHKIVRMPVACEELEDVVNVVKNAKKPLVICGGGVRYSEAGEALEKFCAEFNIVRYHEKSYTFCL